jgi:hypothetical protein
MNECLLERFAAVVAAALHDHHRAGWRCLGAWDAYATSREVTLADLDQPARI